MDIADLFAQIAQVARENAARTTSAFTQRNKLESSDRWGDFPASQNVDDRRQSDTIFNATGFGVPWNDLKTMTQHPMTPWRDLVALAYPPDTASWETSLSRDAGANLIGPNSSKEKFR